METTKPRFSPQGPVSPDDCGLWMKMDVNPETDRTGSPSVNCGEKPQDQPEEKKHGPAVITRYYSVMDDDDFPPPPPPHTAPFLPAEGSTDAQVNNSSVTLTKGAAEATEANDNPGGLDRHPAERRLMATHNQVEEVIVSTQQTSSASMDTASLSKDSILPQDQDQTSMEDACSDPTGRRHQENTTGDGESDEEPEDIGFLSEGQETCRETEAGKDNYPKPSSIEENSENETHFDKEGASEDICGPAETDSKLIAENADCGDVETNSPAESSLSASDDDFKSDGPQELCKSDQHTMDRATGQPQVQEVPAGESNGDEEHVDTRSLNYTLTKYNWVRRESGNSETQAPRLSVSDGDEEMATKDEQGDGGRRISTGVQQGESLLQRLQLVQLRQDVSMPESPLASQQVVQETRGERLGTEVDDLRAREAHLRGADEEEEGIFHSVESEGARSNVLAMENNERKDVEAKARRSSSTTPVESERHKIAREEAGDSDGDHSDGGVPEDSSQIDPNETSTAQIPVLSFCHRLSVAETCIERQEAQRKQNLQRAGGVVNLADNPDVLEIPFKNNISLEPFPTKDGPDQRSDWQFSERKMKKEISQETQRELVLFNQGRIPGEYSKGEVRQLKETKLLFEAFQQDNMEGPTRHRKPPLKGRVYPSVLERTRSLEMLSLKMCPVSRAHSFRLDKETETNAEILRPMSPTGGSRDKPCSSPYAKPDKHLCRSMDSLSMDVSTRSEAREGNGAQGSPILRGNPFFKLRPALGLKPEVEKDIREAKEREEELRRQRSSLYGENRRSGEDGERSRFKATLVPDVSKQSRGKLERVWPPPSKKDQTKTEQIQQEPKVPRAGGQRAPLWQRWESGLINGKTSKEKN